MTLGISIIDFVNIILLSAGIGVCGMIFLQVCQSPAMDKKLKHLFEAFFVMLAVNLAAQVIVQALMENPGRGVHVTLYVVLFIDLAVGGAASFLISLIILHSVQAGEKTRYYRGVLIALISIHVLLLVINIFNGSMYQFDEGNVYHRQPLYILTNLCYVLMLLVDADLLIRYRNNASRRIRTAFWVYITAPILAIIIQTLAFGLQYILISTIIAAVYVSLTIFREQNTRFESQHSEYLRVETELNMASSIQTNMLPSIFPAFPDRKEFSIYATMDPAKEVGGDFYDFFMVDDDHLAMVTADVSGKGVPAALFMMTVRTMLKGTAQAGLSPAQVLAHVNGQICENNPEYMFVTVWLGKLELSTGKLVWADAGHDPLLLYQAGEWKLQPKKGGIALGFLEPEFMREDAFVDCELTLRPGDGLFQYTDGVTESMTAELEQFGYERLVSALGSSPSADPETLLPHLRGEIDAFVRGADQFDDITMLGMRYYGPQGKK